MFVRSTCTINHKKQDKTQNLLPYFNMLFQESTYYKIHQMDGSKITQTIAEPLKLFSNKLIATMFTTISG